MNFNHVGDHLPAGQAVIDSVRALALAVTDICRKIPGPVASGRLDPLSHFFHKDIQMSASRMAVTKGALDQHLHFSQILRLPARPDAQRVKFRRQFSHFLTLKFHKNPLPFLI